MLAQAEAEVQKLQSQAQAQAVAAMEVSAAAQRAEAEAHAHAQAHAQAKAQATQLQVQATTLQARAEVLSCSAVAEVAGVELPRVTAAATAVGNGAAMGGAGHMPIPSSLPIAIQVGDGCNAGHDTLQQTMHIVCICYQLRCCGLLLAA